MGTKDDLKVLREDLIERATEAGIDPERIAHAVDALDSLRGLALGLTEAMLVFGPRPDSDSAMLRSIADKLDQTDAIIETYWQRQNPGESITSDHVQQDLRRIADLMDSVGWDDFSRGISAFNVSRQGGVQ